MAYFLPISIGQRSKVTNQHFLKKCVERRSFQDIMYIHHHHHWLSFYQFVLFSMMYFTLVLGSVQIRHHTLDGVGVWKNWAKVWEDRKMYYIYLFRYKLPHCDCLGISRFFKEDRKMGKECDKEGGGIPPPKLWYHIYLNAPVYLCSIDAWLLQY